MSLCLTLLLTCTPEAQRLILLCVYFCVCILRFPLEIEIISPTRGKFTLLIGAS